MGPVSTATLCEKTTGDEDVVFFSCHHAACRYSRLEDRRCLRDYLVRDLSLCELSMLVRALEMLRRQNGPDSVKRETKVSCSISV